MMKVAFAMFASAMLYGAGHAVSRVFMLWDWSATFLYPIYNRLMTASVDVEDWAGISFMWGPALDSDADSP